MEESDPDWEEVVPESEEAVPCADCGERVYPGSTRGYAPSESWGLCWSCAIRRGGSYDADQDRWTRAPHVADLRRTWQPRK